VNNGFVRWLLDVERLPADAEGLRLAWERPLPGWAWMLLLLGAVAFAVWCYGRLAGNAKGRMALATVRTAAILLLVAIISGPMLELPRTTIEEDWVLLLADRSESMSIPDAPSSTGARSSRNQQLDRVIRDHADLWKSMDERRRLLWLGFADGAFELEAGQERDDPSNTPSAAPPLGPAEGRRTNLHAAIEQALQRAAARQVAGVVVFSDGRTAEPPSRSLIRRLQAEQIQVFVVPLGSDEALGDMAVRRVDAPRRAFVRDKVPVVVELDRFGEAVSDLGATLTLVDEQTGETLDTIRIEPGDDRSAVTLTAEPNLAGEATWRVEIDAGGLDLVPENNIRPFSIELVDRPLRVLYVDGYARWEHRYLKWVLIRESSIESSVMQLSADRDFAQEGNMPITRLPRSPEEFAQFDVIILGDVSGSFFSPSQLEMIRDHVAERGAGLLWIAGERWTPSSFVGTASVLADLVPIRGSLALPPIGEPVNMAPTQLAERLGVLRLISGGETGWPPELADPSFRWSRLWWAQRIDPASVKPTAQALAVTTSSFDGAPLPLVLHMRYGAGQVIYVATDEIWRWRYGRGDLLPEQFWLQMVRMLGRETLAGADDPAVLEAEPRRVSPGQPVQVTLRLLDARLLDLNLESVRASMEDASGAPLGEIHLRRVEGSAGEYATTLIPDAIGALRLRVSDSLVATQPLVADVEVFNPDNELRRPETDHALLASLAEETGGRVLPPDDLSELSRLRNRSIETPNPLSERIWDTPLAFALLLLLLTAEWIGRKIAGLA
jgi:hypothetical protein